MKDDKNIRYTSNQYIKLSKMITKYFTKVSVKFDPFSISARPARLFLSTIPLTMRGACIIDYKILTSNSPSSEKPSIEVTFKDKVVMKADPQTMNFEEVRGHFDSHSRKLALQDAITE